MDNVDISLNSLTDTCKSNYGSLSLNIFSNLSTCFRMWCWNTLQQEFDLKGNYSSVLYQNTLSYLVDTYPPYNQIRLTDFQGSQL